MALRCLISGLISLLAFSGTHAAPEAGTVTEVTSFSVPKAPSGMFYYASQDLLYVLCGTATNADHYLYVMSTSGSQKCFITIPEAVKMSRVDGFYIVGSTAYIVDSQGPMHSGSADGSVYAVDWTNPCSCTSSGTCSSSTATWSPTITKTWKFSASQSDISDGSGNDDYFRNSGIVVSGDYLYAVNGVHPNPGLTCCYPKSLVKVKMDDSSIASKWAFTASTLGHDVDMEGLTCGADGCATYIYMGDEWNYIYRLTLGTSDPASAVEVEWNARSIVGNVNDDKGIESLTYAPTTGYFYAGIQDSSTIHVLKLESSSDGTTTTTTYTGTTTTTTEGPTTTTTVTTNTATTVLVTLTSSTSKTTCLLSFLIALVSSFAK
jgi:hypothetical protein